MVHNSTGSITEDLKLIFLWLNFLMEWKNVLRISAYSDNDWMDSIVDWGKDKKPKEKELKTNESNENTNRKVRQKRREIE